MPAFAEIPQPYDFLEAERRTVAFWKEREIFRKSLAAREGCPRFVFYEGPPTANGKPHPGHVLGRVIKDLFPRYKTMKGFLSPRKAGWDTHGLPVEIEVEKELGISGKEEIEKFGVERFALRCLESVFRYTREWEDFTERIGFWLDLSEAYVTFHQSYVESVWWSLQQLFRRGLLYQDRKVVWWWAQGGTTLSAAEVGLGYREVSDPSVYVRFRSEEDPNLSYLAWTTTPWTLPSNVALAVHPEASYVRVDVPVAGGGTESLVVAEALVSKVLGKKVAPLSASPSFPGKALVGKKYRPLFDFARPEGGRCFEIVPADFVIVDPAAGDAAGTGFVHIAPAFGEEDYRLAKSLGLGFLQLVDERGRMTAEVKGFAGVFCKDADRGLTQALRASGALFREENCRHEYPFCWRAENDPLIQYARPAWFISTSRFRELLLANGGEVRWIPDHIRTGRFGKFLETNVDWALSRERYWGTPLPIWKCEATGYAEAIGSYAELVAKPGASGMEVFERARERNPDLPEHLRVHKPYIDAITYDSPKRRGARMRRVPEVIDCWYDSGAMPFAQWGYPHAPGSERLFREHFPADFISEGIDQTRGWFYTLIAESTLVHDSAPFPHPFRTCIVTGHVCDEKGVKMSKRKRNYLDPKEVLDAHGADAVRWYFLSQVQPWTNMRFSMARVSEAKKDFLIRLQNVWSFFAIYARIDRFDPTEGNERARSADRAELAKARSYVPVAERPLMDRWEVSDLERTVRRVTRALDDYDILDASKALFDYVDRLSNWYVRTSRSRFWAPGVGRDKLSAYWTLYESLVTLARLLAPFVPFFAEDLYRHLVAGPWGGAQPESVHLTRYPECDPSLIDEGLARRMDLVLEIVTLGRAARAEAGLRVRQPLREAIVVVADEALSREAAGLAKLAADELNVKAVRFAEDADLYVRYQVKPNFRLIGPRLGPLVQKLKGVLAEADGAALRAELESLGKVVVDAGGTEVSLSREELEVSLSAREGYAAKAGRSAVVVLDTAVDRELLEEWWAREVVAAVNGLRGDRSLPYEARIRLEIWCGEELRRALEKHRGHLEGETLSKGVEFRAIEEPGGALELRAGEHPYRVDFAPA